MRGSKSGIAALATILFISGLVVEIGLAFAFMAYFSNYANLGFRNASEALMAAQAGVEDGILRIIRGYAPSSYTLPLGSGAGSASANVTVTAVNAQQMLVDSIGLFGNRKRRLNAYVETDALTKLVKVQSVTEITITP